MRERLAGLVRLTAGGLAIAAAATCSPSPPEAPAGRLQVQWVGADTGKLSAQTVAEWCDSLRVLELRAIHGDTGIALLLYPSDSVVPGRYPIVPPQRADSVRPSAAIALRWFAETSIRGFRGDSGSVALTAENPGAGTGRFTAHLRSTVEGSRLTLTGSFSGIAVTPAPPGCAGVSDVSEDPGEPEEEESDGTVPRETSD